MFRITIIRYYDDANGHRQLLLDKVATENKRASKLDVNDAKIGKYLKELEL